CTRDLATYCVGTGCYENYW
nr:immunoglobulin heavy chain junction region [Macaca mulatta]